jgi:hypothetical protein
MSTGSYVAVTPDSTTDRSGRLDIGTLSVIAQPDRWILDSEKGSYMIDNRHTPTVQLHTYTVTASSLNGKREYSATVEASSESAARQCFRAEAVPQITDDVRAEFNRAPIGVSYLVDPRSIVVTVAADTVDTSPGTPAQRELRMIARGLRSQGNPGTMIDVLVQHGWVELNADGRYVLTDSGKAELL